jgi:hypothetical protein
MSLVGLVQVAGKNRAVTGISHKNALEETTSAGSGFSNKQYFIVLLTESAGSILSGSEQCWYEVAS